ncbi:MAG: hypothetical protein ACK559_12355, partial [bacterium]
GVLHQRRRLGALAGGIDGSLLRLDQIAVEAVLLEGRAVGLAVEALGVGLVVSEDPAAFLLAIQPVHPQMRDSVCEDGAGRCILASIRSQTDLVFHLFGITPAPCVTQPKGGQQGEGSGRRTTIGGGNANQQIIR